MDKYSEYKSNMYFSPDNKFVINREYGRSTNGNPLLGRWVLREIETGVLIDYDTHRHDLAERNGVELL